MEINGAVSLITGGASGLGLAAVKLFHALGSKVAILDRWENPEIAHDILYFNCDVTNQDSVSQCISEIVGKWGKIDILMNFAGVLDVELTLSENGVHSLDMYKKVNEINLVGTFNVCRLVAD